MTQGRSTYIGYEYIDPGIARITLRRPEKRNAQSMALLYELNAAFDRAVTDEDVRAIVLAAEGPDFSAGHDPQGSENDVTARVGTSAGYWESEIAGLFAQEADAFVGLCERWRGLSKVTIAQVQGNCIAGGVMLAWSCDLIVASEDAVFVDQTINMGVSGLEFFMYAYEMGMRRAKEFLFTSDPMTAQEALEAGMVNRVVPRARLEKTALELARKIASKPAFGMRSAKMALNYCQDLAGRAQAVQYAYAMHHLTHADNQARHGMIVDPAGFPPKIADRFRELAKVHRARFGKVEP